MGILCDYFTAPDDATAAATVDWVGGPSDPPPSSGLLRRRKVAPRPTLSLPGIEPTMWMGKLEEVVTGRSFDDIVEDPTGHVVASRDDGERLVVSLTENLHRALLTIEEDRVDEVAARWGEPDEEYGTGADPADAAPLLRELIGLARAAHRTGERLYCWVSV